MLKIIAIIITKDRRYEKVLDNNYARNSIAAICTDTLKQLDSEQYILQKGFRKIK